MPHQCVRCSSRIQDGSKQLLEGCEKCGSKFFFYIKGKELNTELIKENLSDNEITEMETDVRQLLNEKDPNKSIILDLETIKTLGPGKFTIDVSALMRGAPIVINISDGKYYIDLASAFKEGKNNSYFKHLK